ncbi:UNVERIFIED_CONTAM: hypothetical protein HDU68_007825 [Siphonaria sp. JEL0065]|nr:hypothetical protein HDU68_007825 [Siphonaria sp. JEL0065]
MPVQSIEEIQVLSNPHSASSSHKRTIAIALDMSSYSEFAFNWAIENYLRPDDLVVLLNVLQHASNGVGTTNGLDAFGTVDSQVVAETSAKQQSHALLAKFSKILAANGYQYRALSVVGHVKEAIVHKVKELNATTLILGSRGANALSRSLLGSVSDYCTHHCHCPVLIAKSAVGGLQSEHHHVSKEEEGFVLPPVSTVKIL